MKRICSLFLFFLLLTACSQPAVDAPTWQEQYDLGVRYLSEGNYEEAIIAFTAAIEIDPKKPNAFIRRAESYIYAGETDESLGAALKDYEAAIELNEVSVDAWLGLVDVYVRLGDFDQAIEILSRAITVIGNDEKLAAKMDELTSGTISDAEGKLRLRSGFDADGNLSWYHTFEYNVDGATSMVSHFDAQGAFLYAIDYAYDEQGQVLRGTNGYLIDSGMLRPTEYVRDNQGDVISVITYDYNGNVEESVLFEWNEAHNVRTTKEYGSSGDLQASSSTTFDKNENPILIVWFDSSGNERSRGVYEYGGDNLLQSLTWYSPEGAVSSQWRYYYDENGNEIKMEQYDENGNLTNSVSGD